MAHRYSSAFLVFLALAVPGQCDEQDSVAMPQACATGDSSCSDKSLLQRRKTEVKTKGQTADPMVAFTEQVSELAKPGALARQGKLDSIMTQLVSSKNELAVTPGLKEHLDKIGEYITTIKGAITDAHSSSAAFVSTSFGQFATCKTQLTTATEEDVADAKAAYEALSTPNSECRDGESDKKDILDACKATEAEKLGTKTTNCEVFDEAERRAIDVDAHKSFVDFREDETSYAYITRLHLHFKKLYDEFVAAKELCDTAATDHEEEQNVCDEAETEHTNKNGECDDTQENMDDAACGYAVKSTQTCSSYDTCYDLAKGNYEAVVAEMRAEEADRRGEWEAAERIDCIRGTFGDAEEEGSSHDTAGLQECISKDISTDHLNLDYPANADKEACTPDSTADPCSDAYKAKHVATLPANAAAQECRVCPGL